MTKKIDNPNAFKHQVGMAVCERLARALKTAYPEFDDHGFLTEVERALPALELKERVAFVSDAMATRLPHYYLDALGIVLKSMGPELSSDTEVSQGLFYHWIHAHFVETRGLDHVPESLSAMCEITKRSTSEFAVRPYLIKDHRTVLSYLRKLTSDPNPHVRRWVSEGTRPLLPWGKRVPAFVSDPTLTLPLLERLRKDPSLYVRNSVANHLNDIAKHHPDVVVNIVRRWLKEGFLSAPWIANRALRHLVKQGHKGALSVLGFSGDTSARLKNLLVDKESVKIGDALQLSFFLVSSKKEKAVVDYALSYPRVHSHGKKVFKLSVVSLVPKQPVIIKKKVSFRPVTTRKIIPGSYTITILVNGNALGSKTFLVRK